MLAETVTQGCIQRVGGGGGGLEFHPPPPPEILKLSMVIVTDIKQQSQIGSEAISEDLNTKFS